MKKSVDSILTKCHRCGNEWRFSGKGLRDIGRWPIYAQCTRCKTSVRVPFDNQKLNKESEAVNPAKDKTATNSIQNEETHHPI